MACSKEHLCLKLHDRIKVISHGDKSAVFPSFLRIICSGCCAVAVFSLRNDGFAVPMVGSATCWTVLSGRTSRCPGHSHSWGVVHPGFFAERGVLQEPHFLQVQQHQGPASVLHRAQRETGPYWALFLLPYPIGSDPKDTSWYISCT